MNTLDHLPKLAEISSNSRIEFLTPSVFPGNHCPMSHASKLAHNIQGLSTLVVGMQECTTYSRFFNPEPEGFSGELHWLYTLDANEVIFGCRDGLIDALKKMAAAGAKSILIIATCIPELIGEDIEGIIHETQPELSARLSFTLLGQFKNIGNNSGSRKAMTALTMFMNTQQKHSMSINVLLQQSGRKKTEAPSLVKTLYKRGFSLRHIGSGSSLADLKKAPDAALNLVISENTLALAVEMEKLFGTPYLDMHALYDVREIDQAYSDLAQRLNIEWDDVIYQERQSAIDLEHFALNQFRGIRSVFGNRVEAPVALAAYLGRLGMAPLLMHLEEYRDEDNIFREALTTMGHTPFICRIVNQQVDLPILKSLEPDIFIGHILTDISLREGGRFRDKNNQFEMGHRGGKRDFHHRDWRSGGYHENNQRGKRKDGNNHRGGMPCMETWLQTKENSKKGRGSYAAGMSRRKNGKGRAMLGIYESLPWVVPYSSGQIGYARTTELLRNISSALDNSDILLRRAL